MQKFLSLSVFAEANGLGFALKIKKTAKICESENATKQYNTVLFGI